MYLVLHCIWKGGRTGRREEGSSDIEKRMVYRDAGASKRVAEGETAYAKEHFVYFVNISRDNAKNG